MKLTLPRVSEIAQKTKTHVDSILHPKRMWLIVAGLALLVSLAAALLHPYRRSIVLWFPEGRTGKLKAEMRLVPWNSGKIAAVARVAEELLLGPADPKLKPFTDQRVNLKAVIPAKNRYIIVLDSTAVFAGPARAESTEYQKFFTAIAKAVTVNTGIRHVAVAIEGYIVFSK